MTNPDDLVDALVAAQLANTDFVTAVGDPRFITGYKDFYPTFADWNLTALQLLAAPPYAITRYRDSRAGRQSKYTRYQAVIHEFSIYLRPQGSAPEAWYHLREGINGLTGQKFKLSTIHPNCYPPEAMDALDRSIKIGSDVALDYLEIQFFLTERGVDD